MKLHVSAARASTARAAWHEARHASRRVSWWSLEGSTSRDALPMDRGSARPRASSQGDAAPSSRRHCRAGAPADLDNRVAAGPRHEPARGVGQSEDPARCAALQISHVAGSAGVRRMGYEVAASARQASGAPPRRRAVRATRRRKSRLLADAKCAVLLICGVAVCRSASSSRPRGCARSPPDIAAATKAQPRALSPHRNRAHRNQIWRPSSSARGISRDDSARPRRLGVSLAASETPEVIADAPRARSPTFDKAWCAGAPRAATNSTNRASSPVAALRTSRARHALVKRRHSVHSGLDPAARAELRKPGQMRDALLGGDSPHTAAGVREDAGTTPSSSAGGALVAFSIRGAACRGLDRQSTRHPPRQARAVGAISFKALGARSLGRSAPIARPESKRLAAARAKLTGAQVRVHCTTSAASSTRRAPRSRDDRGRSPRWARQRRSRDRCLHNIADRSPMRSQVDLAETL